MMHEKQQYRLVDSHYKERIPEELGLNRLGSLSSAESQFEDFFGIPMCNFGSVCHRLLDLGNMEVLFYRSVSCMGGSSCIGSEAKVSNALLRLGKSEASKGNISYSASPLCW